jgi:signal transduction histidine kinase
MKGFFKTFYGKLSALFLVLLLVMGSVQILITINSWKTYYDEADQKLNQRLARDMAKELKPIVKDSLDLNAVHHSIHYMMVMNPKVEIYLLDSDGKIMAFFAEPDKKVKSTHVGLKPVQNFLDKSAEFPILGDDPRNPGITKPFSAARLDIGPDINGYLYIILGSEQFDAAINTTRESYVATTIAKGLLITVLFTAFLGLLLFAFLTRRLRDMTHAVESFKKGIYSSRVEVKSSDELANLAKTFNTMAETIEANIEELKKTDTLRRELIANVSHDLRSPLASIRGYLETIQIKDKTLSDEERERYINILLDSTSGLERLVEQLFELSKLDARQIEPTYEPFLLKEMVYDVMMKFKPRAEKAGVKLQIKIPDGLPQVYADVGLIERVLSNLLDNAIKYTPKNGTVYISTDKVDKDIIRVRVKDNGPGIKQDELPYIFDRFYRVDKSRSEKTGGTGLGLAIAKKIMEIHNSTISVVSELNKGSTFSFSLQPWHAGRA